MLPAHRQRIFLCSVLQLSVKSQAPHMLPVLRPLRWSEAARRHHKTAAGAGSPAEEH